MNESAVTTLCRVLVIAGLAALAWPLAQRPLWIDEAMLAVNFPLSGPAAYLVPLPLYEQAVPPLYALLRSLVAPLGYGAERAVFFALIVLGCLSAAGFWRLRGWRVLVLGLGCAALWWLVYMASELKHYGLEMLGSAIIAGWAARRAPDRPAGAGDAALLAGAMLCGISTLVIAVVAAGLFLFWRLLETRRLDPRDLGFGVAMLAAAGLYYLWIRRLTEIQVASYGDVYARGGAGIARDYLMTLLRVPGAAALPALGLTALWLLWRIRQPAVARFVLFALAVVAAFGLLAMLGLYPATMRRYLTWSMGLWLVALGLALALSAAPGVSRRLGAALALVLGLALLPPLAGSLRDLADPARPHVFTENDRALDWLAGHAPAPVILWAGSQPVIDAYLAARPDLGRHDYLGRMNPVSAIPSWDDSRPEAEIAADILSRRQDPGAWARLAYFRAREDYTALADTLIAEAPRGTPFVIFASHAARNAGWGQHGIRQAALTGALEMAGCRYDTAFEARMVFAYEALCPE